MIRNKEATKAVREAAEKKVTDIIGRAQRELDRQCNAGWIIGDRALRLDTKIWRLYSKTERS